MFSSKLGRPQGLALIPTEIFMSLPSEGAGIVRISPDGQEENSSGGSEFGGSCL
jgi:hypothetical protein